MTVHASSKSHSHKGLTASDKAANAALEAAVAVAPVASGATGKVAASLKHLLKLAGYGSYLNGNPAVGGGTVKALQAFQSASGLPATGQLDADTLKKLEHLELHMRLNGDRFAGAGQRGDEILKAEKRLKLLGYDVGPVDGIYDAQDAAAVAAFRHDEGGKTAGRTPLLTTNAQKLLRGEVNDLHHDAFHTRVKKTGERVRLDKLTTREAARGIAEGDQGRAVKNLQAHLKAAGYDPKHANGKFDERTRAMVEAFQRHSGLPETGKVDARTWARLQGSRLLAHGSFDPAQYRGERSSAVKATQKELRDLGYKHVKVNGSFDAATERAVKAFEKKHHLKADGKVSQAEFEKMKKVEAQASTKTVQGCAQFLLHSPNVSFWTGLSSGSDRKNLERLARGEKAYVPATGGHVMPSLKMMQALVDMAKHGRIMINALTGGTHSPNSNHYRGLAVDLDLSTGNAGMIERIANQHGGTRNFETDHIHLDF